MSRHFCFRIVHQQSADQYAERVALPFRACVFGIPIVVQSAFVGDSDRVGIVAAGVGAGPLDRAGSQDLSVTADVEMIARAIKSTSSADMAPSASMSCAIRARSKILASWGLRFRV